MTNIKLAMVSNVWMLTSCMWLFRWPIDPLCRAGTFIFHMHTTGHQNTIIIHTTKWKERHTHKKSIPMTFLCNCINNMIIAILLSYYTYIFIFIYYRISVVLSLFIVETRGRCATHVQQQQTIWHFDLKFDLMLLYIYLCVYLLML